MIPWFFVCASHRLGSSVFVNPNLPAPHSLRLRSLPPSPKISFHFFSSTTLPCISDAEGEISLRAFLKLSSERIRGQGSCSDLFDSPLEFGASVLGVCKEETSQGIETFCFTASSAAETQRSMGRHQPKSKFSKPAKYIRLRSEPENPTVCMAMRCKSTSSARCSSRKIIFKTPYSGINIYPRESLKTRLTKSGGFIRETYKQSAGQSPKHSVVQIEGAGIMISYLQSKGVDDFTD
jgi:hypothetical protein